MWPLLLMMAAMAGVQGTQYGDYGAAKMPAYGEYEAPRDLQPHEDYRLPAASSPDLYEEENKAVTQKSLSKDYENVNSWQKPHRQMKHPRNNEEYSETLDSRLRDSGNRKFRDDHDRSPFKNDKLRDVRARVKHKRDQHDDRNGDDDEFSIEKYIRGINENNLEADVTRSSRRITDRIIHRKPRDRDIGKVDAAFRAEDFEEEIKPDLGRAPGPLKDMNVLTDTDREDLQSDEIRRLDNLGDLPIDGGRRQGDTGSRRRGYDDTPRLRPAQRARLDPGDRDYDSDYYDLKRLQNVRKKLPGYRRRPQVSEEDWSETPLEKLKQLENRRLMKASGQRPTPVWSTSLRSPPSRRTSTTTDTTTNSDTTRATTTSTVATPVKTSTEPTLTSSKIDKAELSLAEKSRLSIMKKISYKERLKDGPPSTKPPVLLQVTKQLPTVVLVEASTTKDPWMGAREIHADSPENLAKVRQLMRSKLVANAKDIRDLTEDWDQVICDYVDVGILKDRAPLLRSNSANFMLVTFSLARVM